jgi:hypothetical protein
VYEKQFAWGFINGFSLLVIAIVDGDDESDVTGAALGCALGCDKSQWHHSLVDCRSISMTSLHASDKRSPKFINSRRRFGPEARALGHASRDNVPTCVRTRTSPELMLDEDY